MTQENEHTPYRSGKHTACWKIIDQDKQAIKELVEALVAVDHELGRLEGLGLPAPIVNASEIAQMILSKYSPEKR